MRILQRQIFKELVTIFGVCLGAVLVVLLIGRLLQMRELVMGQDISVLDLGRLFVYLSPFFMSLLIPVSCMLAIFLTFLRMGTDRELIALRAGGLGVYRFLPGPLLFSLMGVFCCGVMTLYGISWGMDHFRQTVYDLARTKATLKLRPGVFNTDFSKLVIFALRVDPRTGDMEKVFVEDATDPHLRTTIVAPRGRIVADSDAGEMFFVLTGGTIYRYTEDEIDEIGFDSYRVRMDMNSLLGGSKGLGDKRIKSLSPEEIRARLAALHPGSGKDAQKWRDLKAELYKRYALPVACLVLGLFAIPLAFLFQGMNRQYGLVLVLGFFMLYYSLFSLGMVLAETGTLAPGMAMWMPNVIFALLTVGGFVLVAREKNLDAMSFWGWCRTCLQTRKPHIVHEQ
ncbi:LPS export ABC transporter permease LptF [Desulfoplanes formicivorans]|uniref:Permease n=1 Tax=Desulfoplanes formicivorans TaxID=1592317 RepID=A0A194AKP3_9BACT|nr:LPS export ABC transporter permease LptF [Desulfoplanes formicivorans]GAU09810.1 permease [Desulfoplanes formicivorans]